MQIWNQARHGEMQMELLDGGTRYGLAYVWSMAKYVWNYGMRGVWDPTFGVSNFGSRQPQRYKLCDLLRRLGRSENKLKRNSAIFYFTQM